MSNSFSRVSVFWMMRAIVIVTVFFVCCLVATKAAGLPTMYTIRKFKFWFNKHYIDNLAAFYQPVRGKWGRIYINLTTVRPFENIWIDCTIYRQQEDRSFQPTSFQFSFNVCDLIKDGASNALLQLLNGDVEKSVRSMISKCPIEAGTKMVVPDQTWPSVPRNGQGPIIPSGYYRYLFNFRSTQPNATLGNATVEIQFRGFW